MTIFLNILTAITPLFALIFLGYLAKKAHLLHVSDTPALNRFVISVSLPAFVFNAILTHKLKADLIQLPLIFWIAELMMFGIAVGVGKLLKWSPASIGTLILQSIFGNTGYVGYPLCTAIMPTNLPSVVIIDQVGMSVPLYPSAPVLGNVFGKTQAERTLMEKLSFLRTPVFIALVLGILLKLLPPAFVPHTPALVDIGKTIMRVVALLGAATIPVVLVAIGVVLRPSSLKKHAPKVAVVGILKMIVMPILVWLVARFMFQLSPSLMAACILEAGTPPSATSTVFAGQYDLDSGLAIASFFALTVISAITLPIMLGLLR
jgi:predicted permease